MLHVMARKPETPPKPSRITVPARCHAAVKVIFAEMKRQSITYDELEYRSGVLKSTFKAWRTNNRPGLETTEAALGALGWAYLPVPTLSQLPPSIREGLQALAAEWGDVNPLLCELLANVCGVEVASGASLEMERRIREISEELIEAEVQARLSRKRNFDEEDYRQRVQQRRERQATHSKNYYRKKKDQKERQSHA